MTKLYVGDVGTQITVDVGEDITSATVTDLAVRKPDGTEVVWSGTHHATTVVYVTVANDLDLAGTYYIQAAVTLPGWSGLGETFNMTVHKAFD